MTDFAETIAGAYATQGPAIDLGRGVHEGAVAPGAAVRIPLGMLTRHGLVAGATGTGKTKTLQLKLLTTHSVRGEAAVTILSDRGVPTPVVHTRMVAPRSRMAPADDVDAAAKGPALRPRWRGVFGMLRTRIRRPPIGDAAGHIAQPRCASMS